FAFCYFVSISLIAIFTLSLHDALPIFESPRTFRLLNWDSLLFRFDNRGTDRALSIRQLLWGSSPVEREALSLFRRGWIPRETTRDRKSTRLNSSHQIISYAVFCLKKKK